MNTWKFCERFKSWMKSVGQSMLKQLKFKEGEDLNSLKTVSMYSYGKKISIKFEYFEKYEWYKKVECKPESPEEAARFDIWIVWMLWSMKK